MIPLQDQQQQSHHQHAYEPLNSPPPSILSKTLHQINPRRYRSLVLAAICLTIIPTIWFLCVHGGSAGGFGDMGSGWGFPRWNQILDQDGEGIVAAGGREGGVYRPDAAHGIPPSIWQIMIPKSRRATNETFVIDPERLQDTASWLAMNPDTQYTLIGEKGADMFMNHHFSNNPRILKAYHNMPNVGMKSDLLRYLVLHVKGGVYTDTDTVAVKPIRDWVPSDLQDKVRLIVGIEFDRRDAGPWADISHWVQFCQWTIAAAPGHSVFMKMTERVLRSLNDLSEEHGVPVNEVHPSSFDVMKTTGPAAWTDVVFEQLQEVEPGLNSTKDLAFMKEPKLYGDILVLSIDGFGMGQPHSKSTNDGTIPKDALIRHLFRGSWRADT